MHAMTLWSILLVNLISVARLVPCLAASEVSACPHPPLPNDVATVQSSSLVQANTRRSSSKPMLDDEPSPDLQPQPSLTRQRSALDPGLVVVRVPKTGSTTLQAIAERIGQIYNGTVLSKNRRKGPEELFAEANTSHGIVYTGHGELSSVQHLLRAKVPQAFKVAMVREPAERCLSTWTHLFMGWHEDQGYNDTAKVAFMSGDCEFFTDFGQAGECKILKCPGFMSRYLQPHDGASLEETLASYTIIGMTERFDESMLLMSQKLGLSIADVLYVQVKESGGDSDCNTVRGAGKFSHTPLEEEPFPVQAAAWNLQHGSKDQILYRRVNATLNREIAEYLGDFQADLALFRSWLAIAEDKCRCVPVSATYIGTDENEWDSSFACIDELVRQRGWKTQPLYTFRTWLTSHNETTA